MNKEELFSGWIHLHGVWNLTWNGLYEGSEFNMMTSGLGQDRDTAIRGDNDPRD